MSTQIFRILLIAASFFLPVIILTSFFAWFELYPFGMRSHLVMDMDGQIVDFMAVLRDKIVRGETFFFSWSKSLGTSFIGMFSFYLSSPFNLLMLLFSREDLPFAILCIILVKIGTAGLTMCFYLLTRFKVLNPAVVVFSTYYALMSYSIAYMMSPMWLDGVLWLPVVVMGIDRILEKNRPLLFLVSFCLAIFSNFYTAYMVGIFGLLYFVWQVYVLGHSLITRQSVFKFFVFSGSGLIAAGLNAWLLLPTFLSLRQNRVNTETLPGDNLVGFQFSQFFSKFFVGIYDDITNAGMPNVFCGTPIVILIVAFFMVRTISVREKIATFLFLFTMALSFYLVPLNLFWHLTVSPVWFPYRYSFVFSFLLVLIGYHAYLELNFIRTKLLVGSFLAVAIVCVFCGFLQLPFMDAEHVQVALGSILASAIVLVFRHAYTRKSLLTVGFLILICAFESTYNANEVFLYFDRIFRYQNHADYGDFRSSVKPLIDKVKEDDPSFFRLEKNFQRTINDSFNLDYRGLSHYSSDFTYELYRYLSSLGFSFRHFWVNTSGSTKAMEMLFGVKYMVSKRDMSGLYPLVESHEGVHLYQNPIALPIGYMVDTSGLDYVVNGTDFLRSQNFLLKFLSGQSEDVFSPVHRTNVVVQSQVESQPGSCETGVGRCVRSFIDDFYPDLDGPVYTQFPAYTDQIFEVAVNGVTVHPSEYTGYSGLLYLGRFKAGEKVELRLRSALGPEIIRAVPFFTLDDVVLAKVYKKLSSNPFEVSKFWDNGLEGTVEVAERQLFLTSIPYDRGWKVTVDGSTVTTLAFQNALLSFKLAPGKHHVLMEFVAEGLHAGMLTSGLSLVFAVLFLIACLKGRVYSRG